MFRTIRLVKGDAVILLSTKLTTLEWFWVNLWVSVPRRQLSLLVVSCIPWCADLATRMLWPLPIVYEVAVTEILVVLVMLCNAIPVTFVH